MGKHILIFGLMVVFCLGLPSVCLGQQGKMKVACGVEGLADWGTSLPFMDVAKLSRGWIEIAASKPIDYPHGEPPTPVKMPTDQDDYPLEIPSGGKRVVTVLLVGVPKEAYPMGKYTLIFDGAGELNLGWDGGDQTVKSAGATTSFEFEPKPDFNGGKSKGMLLTILKSDKADHIRNVRIIMPGFADTYDKDPWNPKFLEDLKPFACIRFMDWCNVNNSQQSDWSKRTRKTSFCQTGWIGKGVAYEYMIELGNRLGKDIWLCVPHLADDNYMQELAKLVASTLKPGLKCYIEFSNETWNGIFKQCGWTNGHGGHVRNAVRLFKAFDEAFQNDHSRYVKVLAGWTINDKLTQDMIKQLDDKAVNPDGVKADAYAIAPYIGHDANGNVDSILRELRAHIGRVAQACLKQRQVCDKAGLKLICYEGGTHALKGEFIAANSDPRIYDVYMEYLKALEPSVEMFNQFVAVSEWGQYGCWGAKRYVGEPLDKAHKYRALVDYIAKGAK